MNWKRVKIPEVLFFQEGPGVRNTQFKETGVKLLNVGNINDGRINLSSTKIHISEDEAYGKYKHFLVDEGDLIIASSGIVVDNFHNKIAIVDKEHLPLCMNTSTIRFKVLDPAIISLSYFKQFLKSSLFKKQIRRLITGSAQLNFGPSHLKQIEIPLPPLAVQQEIAAILDAADALRQKDKALLLQYDALLQSTFHHLFGDPVQNDKGWEVKKLGDCVEFKGGGTPNTKNDSFFQGDIPWVSPKDMKTRIIFDTIDKISLEAIKSSSAKMIPKGSVLVVVRSGILKKTLPLAIAGTDLTVNQDMKAMICNADLVNYFLLGCVFK